MTDYTSSVVYPGTRNRTSEQVKVRVGSHASVNVAGTPMEPHYIEVTRELRNGDDERVVTFHEKADFEDFLANLLDAAEEAYDEPVELEYPPAEETVVIITNVYEAPQIKDYVEIEEVRPLGDDPATPAEQQEALGRLINQEVARQRLEEEGRVLAPYLVNEGAALILSEVIAERADNSYVLDIDAS